MNQVISYASFTRTLSFCYTRKPKEGNMSLSLEFSSDWQLECGEIKQRVAHLFKTGIWSDCTFLVGAEDQVLVKAHKLLLVMASPVFEAMFYGPMAEGNNPIPIPDIQPDTFKALIEYIYTDNIELTSFDLACQLYYGAQKYMLQHLLTICSTYLSCNLTPGRAGCTLEFAQLVGEKELAEECVQMIRNDTIAVLKDDSFEELELDTVVKIFSLDPLNIDNELDLYAAAERYTKAQEKRNMEEGTDSLMEPAQYTFLDNICKKETVDNGEECDPKIVAEPNISPENNVHIKTEFESDIETENAENNPTMEIDSDPKMALENSENYTHKDTESGNLASQTNAKTDHDEASTSVGKQNVPSTKEKDGEDKTNIRRALQQIRFLTLKPQQLAEYQTLTSLLTETEILAFFMNIASSNTHMAMPSGYSTDREQRSRYYV